MVSSGRNERSWINDAVVAAAGATNWATLAHDLLPSLARQFDTSLIGLYRFPDGFYDAPGACTPFETYLTHYFADDPMQEVQRRLNPQLAVVTALVDQDAYRRSAVLNEFYHPLDAQHFISARLHGERGNDPQTAGILLARSARQNCFDATQVEQLRLVMPALQAAAARLNQSAHATNQSDIYQWMLSQVAQDACLALCGGRIVWLSAAAEGVFDRFLGCKHALPQSLLAAAAKIERIAKGEAPGQTPDLVVELAPDGLAWRAHLYLRPGPEPLVLVRLTRAGSHTAVAAAIHGLTRSEQKVLALLVDGKSQPEIARTLFVAVNTVRTHMKHVFKKLDVHTALQAVAKVKNTQMV